MKELMTYVAVDTDDVGESIGNAVLSNDVNSLSSISENINSGVRVFSQWAEYNGGEVISSGSDEAIFQVPQSSIKDLEELKDTYTKQTGFTISIGIGENVSDAAKALIYAKMNGKDQIMDYSPEMERAMKESLTGDVQRLEGGVGDDTDPEDLPQDELEEGIEHELEHTDDEEIAEEIATDHLEESDDYYSDLEEMEEEDAAEEAGQETEEIDVPADEVDGDYGSEEMAEGQPEHELDMDEDEEFIHDAQENREDEADEDIIEADEEDADEAMEDMADSDNPADEDIDLDGQPDKEEEHGEITPDEDLDDDGDVEHEEAMAAESGETEEYDDTGDFGDETQENEELSNAIEEQMGEPEEVIDEAMAIEEEMEGDDLADIEGEENLDHEAIKDVIFESLQNFKQNREYLEGIAQENPELYQSLIFTLQAMIEMAKEFGYGEVEDDMTAQEAEGDMLSEEDEAMAPMADEEMGEEEMNPEDFAVGEEKEEIEKNENFLRLMYKMHRVSEMLNELKKAKIDDEKENVSVDDIRDDRAKRRKEKGDVLAEKDSTHTQKMKQLKRQRKLREINPLPKSENGFEKSEEDKSVEEMKEEAKEKLEAKSKKKWPSKKKRKPSIKKPTVLGKKKKKPQKSSNDGSFCARSHQKMRASGKDCRSNEDKHSPLCSARKKFNCRGKNEEKNKKMDKAEKLKKFLKKKYQNEELEKSRLGTATKETTKKIRTHRHLPGTVKNGYIKGTDENGNTKWTNASSGKVKNQITGEMEGAGGPGLRVRKDVKPQKV
jgi:hypothetical protein